MNDVSSKIGDAELAYFNGSGPKHTTESSTLISSSPYLNDPKLREMMGQEMLRRNGADLPNTAYIPDMVKMFMEHEDWGRIMQLVEEEKARLPEFKAWLDGRKISLFKQEELDGAEPGTLRHVIWDFVTNSGMSMDFFYQGMEIQTDLEFMMKERSTTHDIEHMITGFETNHAGEIALLKANERATYNYFKPELAAFFFRTGAFLLSKSKMRCSLFYPECYKVELEAEEIGIAQGKNWKHPLFIIPYRDYMDWKIVDIREEFGITGAPPSGYWDWTTATSEDPRNDNHAEATAMAAE
jgi:ubiquinone biosynthesis protein Coq4